MLGHLLLEDLLQNYLNAFPDPGLYASRFTLCSNSLFGVKRLPPHSTHNLPDVIFFRNLVSETWCPFLGKWGKGKEAGTRLMAVFLQHICSEVNTPKGVVLPF
jgi:hypothetical protein